jgi:hypothetical protein
MKIEIDHVKQVTSKAYEQGSYKQLGGRERIAVFIRQIPLKGGSKLRIGPKDYKIEDDSFLVFIDLMHDANYTHPVVYELHRVKDGSVKVIKEEFPVVDPEIERSLIPHILPKKKGGQHGL